jgi:hypothetical protein
MAIPENNFLSSSWGASAWTPWMPLSGGSADFRKLVPTSPGFYRVRVAKLNILAYVGQTGRNFRERVRSLAANTYGQSPPWNDPHTAASGLWAWRVEEKLEYEFSVASKSLGYAERQCYEDILLYGYRLERGESTLCNHGRFHRWWSRPSNKTTGVSMRRLEGTDNPQPHVRRFNLFATMDFLTEMIGATFPGRTPWASRHPTGKPRNNQAFID